MNDRKKRFLAILINKCVCYCLIIIILTPYLNRNTPRSFIIALIICWLLSAIQSRLIPFSSRAYNNCTILILFWIVIELVYRVIGISTADWGNYLMNLLSYFAIIIAMTLVETDDDRYKRNIAYLVLAIITLCSIDNFRLSFIYPNATVDINYRWGTEYLVMNIAQTWYYFTAVLAAVFILSILVNERRLKSKIIEIVAFVSLTLFIFFVSPRLIACLLFTVCVASILILKFARGNKVVYFMVLFLFLIAYLLFGRQVLSSIASVISSERIRERILDLASVSTGNTDENGSLLGRLLALRTSITTFFSSIQAFLFGVGYHVTDNAVRIGIGMHSGIIDMLPKYGILGFSIFVSIIKKGVIAVRNVSVSSFCKTLQNVFIISFLLYGFLNQFLTPGIFFAFFFLGVNYKIVDGEGED